MRVTLTHDPATGTTVVDDQADPRGPMRVPQPDGILGACAAGSLYASIGRDVTIRRARPAAVQHLGVAA